jgi:hypothetical protein
MTPVRFAPWLVGIAYAVLALAWAITNPPFHAPDEWAHYLRAVGVANGQLVGAPARYRDPASTPQQQVFDAQLARAVTVPPGLSPNGFECAVRHPRDSAACQDRIVPNAARTVAVTALGTYQPLPYLLPAATIELADHAASADRLARVTALVASVALLGVAVAMLWSGVALSLLGLVLAVTPMVLFVAAGLGGSGLELAAAIAFPAALLRLARDQATTRGVWFAIGFAGAALALSRDLSPLWVAIDLLMLVGLIGFGGLRRRAREQPLAAALAAGTLLTAIALNRVWAILHEPHSVVGTGPGQGGLLDGWRQLRHLAIESIGSFGYLDLRLPATAYVVWAAMVVTLVVVGFALARRRERILLLSAAVACVVVPLVLHAVLKASAGITLQGRHILPLLVLVPLLAGEMILRGRPAAALSRRLTWLVVPAAGVQVVAWYDNAHRAAVGQDGPLAFFAHAQWRPPAGWYVWIVLVIIAAASLAATAWLARDGGDRRLPAG